MDRLNADKWETHWFKVAELTSELSKDRSTKVGAVIVKNNILVSTGYNGFPRSVNDSDKQKHIRPDKYFYTVHAELNAILNAGRQGSPVIDSTMFISCHGYPCSDCTKAIINSGIRNIYLYADDGTFGHNPELWKKHAVYSKKMLAETDIVVNVVF